MLVRRSVIHKRMQTYAPSDPKCAKLKEDVQNVISYATVNVEVPVDSYFTVDDAVQTFTLFCVPAVPRLQASSFLYSVKCLVIYFGLQGKTLSLL